MDVLPTLERLRERLSDLPLREIEAAAGLNGAMNGIRAVPAVYVIPLSERGTQLPHTGSVDQLERRLVGIVLAVEAIDTRGGAGALDLAALRGRIKKALVGWVPEPDTGEPVTFQGGDLVDFPGDGRLWWADEYLLTGYFRSEQ